jgi:MFS family permease
VPKPPDAKNAKKQEEREDNPMVVPSRPLSFSFAFFALGSSSPMHTRSPEDAAGTWGVLAITTGIQALVAMALLTVPAIAPAFASTLALQPSLVGAYIGVAYFGAMLASMSSGAFVLRYGALRASQAALVLCAIGLALPALVPQPWAAVVCAFLVGLGYGPITPASSHLLVRSTPPDRATLVFSIKQTGVPLGGVLAGALVPPLVVMSDVRTALLTVAAASLLCAAAAQPWRGALDADRDPRRPLRMGNVLEGLRLVATHAALKRMAAVSFGFSIVQLCLSTYLVTWLTGTLGYSLVAAGGMLSAVNVGGVVGRVVWGGLADRKVQPMRLLGLLGGAMGLCALACAWLQPGAPGALLLVLLVPFGASAIGWNGIYLAEVARRAPAGLAGAATGGTLACTFLGVVIGPVLFGAIAQATGSMRAGWLALLVPCALCTWSLLRAQPK